MLDASIQATLLPGEDIHIIAGNVLVVVAHYDEDVGITSRPLSEPTEVLTRGCVSFADIKEYDRANGYLTTG